MTAGLTLGLALAIFVQGLALAQPLAMPLTITAGILPPQQRVIQAKVGDRLRWAVTSDQAGELHLHAYRLSFAVPAKQLTPVEFTAHAAGKFKLEWHAKASKESTEKSPTHHAAALARLEVYPP